MASTNEKDTVSLIATCSVCGVTAEKSRAGNFPQWWIREWSNKDTNQTRLLCARCAAGEASHKSSRYGAI